MLGTLEPSKPVLGTRVFVDLLDPSLATWNLETLPGTLTENLRNSWGLYLESLLGALEPSETLLKNLCSEPRPSLGTFQNLYSYLDGTYMLYLEPRNLPEPLLGTLARNLGTFWNPLWLEPLLGTSEPAGTFTWNPYTWNLGTFGTLLGTLTWNLGTCRNLYLEPLYLEPRNLRNLTWNPYLEPRNLPEPFLGTLTRNLETCRNLYLEPLYLEPRNLRNLTWNPYLEPRNLPEPFLGTLTRNLGTCRNLYLEPRSTWNPYLEPRNLPEPLLGTLILGTLTWNLGTCRNLYLEPLLGTSEPARTWRDDCPRVPQGLVWLGPQSFQLLGEKKREEMRMLVHCPIYLAFSITMLWCVHQGDCSFFLHCRSTYYVACRCLCGLLHPKKNHTREMHLLRRFTVGNGRTRFYFLAELYLLFMMDWGLRWGFLVSFCVALFFSVSRNSVSHACTAILRLVHDFWLRKGLSLYKLWDFLPL